MSKFFELLKVNVSLSIMQINIRRFRKGKKQSRSSGYVLLLAAVLIMAYMGKVASILYGAVGPYGLGWLLVAMGLFMVSILTLATGIYSVGAVLFDGRDLDQLFSYPLRPLQILFSKVLGLVVENWLVGIVFFLPFVTVYCINARPGALFYVNALLGFLCLPCIPVSLFILLAYILNFITGGKRARNTINSIVAIGLIAGAVVSMQSLMPGYRNPDVNVAGLMDRFKNLYPPLGYLTSGIVGVNPGDLGIGLLWNVAPFAALCAVLSFGYRALWSRSRAVRKTRRGKLSFGRRSPFAALLQKEFSRYFSSAMYVLNSSIGIILMTLFTVFSGAVGGDIQALGSYFPADMKILFVLLVFAFTLIITNTTAPSISLEGKNLWIIKSLPVEEGKILLAKLCVHLIVTIPLLLVNCVIAGFTMQLRVANCCILFAICAPFAVLGGLVGLIFNLYYHRFDFYSDMQVVKNSASVLLTYLTMLVIAAAFAGIYWLMRASLVPGWFFLGVGLTLAALVAAAAAFVFTKGKELLKELS